MKTRNKLLLFAAIGTIALGGCGDDALVDGTGGDGIVVLAPSVSINGSLSPDPSPIGRGAAGTRAGEVSGSTGTVWQTGGFSLMLEAFGSNGDGNEYVSLLNDRQHVSYLFKNGTFDEGGTPTDYDNKLTANTDATYSTGGGKLYVPANVGSVSVTLGGMDYDGTADADTYTDLPNFDGGYSVGGTTLLYRALLGFLANDGSTVSNSESVTLGTDGTITLPLDIVSAGYLLQMTVAEGYTVTAVRTNSNALGTTTDGCVAVYPQLSVTRDESGTASGNSVLGGSAGYSGYTAGTNADGSGNAYVATDATDGKQYAIAGNLVPATYSGTLCYIDVQPTGGGDIRTVPLDLSGATFTAGGLLVVNVLVDAQRATVGTITVADFVNGFENGEGDITDGLGDYTYNYNSGTGKGTFTVFTGKGLKQVADLINAGINDTGTFDFNGSADGVGNDLAASINILIGTNLDMSALDGSTAEKTYTPIANGSTAYSGTFEGRGMIISGLTINSTGSNVGIIGSLGTGTVQNVVLEEANITGIDNVGSIVGSIDGGTITNCEVSNSTIKATDGSNAGVFYGKESGTITFSGNSPANTNGSYPDANGNTVTLPVPYIYTPSGSTLPNGITLADGTTTIAGTAGHFTVYNGDGLKTVADIINGSGIAEGDTRDSNDGAYLNADITLAPKNGDVIDMTGKSFTPIGNNAEIGSTGNKYRYAGTFDGNSKTIKGLTIGTEGTAYTGTHTGLIGHLNGGTVKDVTLSDAKIYGGTMIGGVAGYVNNVSTVENCRVTGTISGTGYSTVISGTDYYVGGVVGYNNGTITGCSTEGIEVKSASSSVGGVIGEYYDGTYNGTNSATNVKVSGTNNVGGVIGRAGGTGTINGTFRAINVDVTASNSTDTAGIIWGNDGSGNPKHGSGSGTVTINGVTNTYVDGVTP